MLLKSVRTPAMLRLTLLAACLAVVTADTNYRLNTPIVPSAYQITVTPYFDTGDARAFTFDGDVSITFTTNENINQIKLHSEDLKYQYDNITLVNNGLLVPLNNSSPIEFNSKYAFAYINLLQNLQVGQEYVLRIQYEGPIRDDLNGFYRNYYIEKGVKKWLGATQMEPTHARKVFPSFDEPGLKAVFNLVIDRPASYKPTLANTKLMASTPLSNGYVRESFYPTPRMSTYLVAFIVSEFEAKYVSNENGKEFGVYTRPEATNQSEYSYDFGVRVVQALSDYFGIDYYSTNDNLKLDHVALINYRAGAMENWGLVTYRESLLLYIPEESTPYYKYRVAQIIAHETTHMWFGNLVTCHWWSNTWLNEGFANYFQDYITSLIEPEVGSVNALVTGSVYSAYDADSVPSSPAITNDDVNSPEDISGHFGTITYQKAGSIIRMMHHLIGDAAFKYGLNSYLKTHAHQSGYPNYMYNALEEGINASNALAAYNGARIADIMGSWISQPGYPVLEVVADYESNSVLLTQRRFYSKSQQSSNETYKIPITYTTGVLPNFENTKPVFIMEGKTHVFNVSESFGQNHTWIIFNVQETGFYRVKYDLHALQMIASALKSPDHGKIHYLNRAKIVNDLFAFYFAEEISFNVIYDTLDFLTVESDYSVWLAAIRGLNKLRNLYVGTDAKAYIESYALSLMENIIASLGYEVRDGDDFDTLRNRMQLLEFACKLGHGGCLEHSAAKFKSFKESGAPISPSLRPVSYCAGLRLGNGDDYDFLWKRMTTTNVANEARTIGEILGCSNDENSLKKFLVSMLEEDSPIMSQDITVPLSGVIANHSHVQIVINELNENMSLWKTIYPSISTVLNAVAGALRDDSEIHEFEHWLKDCTDCGDVEGPLKTLSQTHDNSHWALNHKNDIISSLKSHAIALPSSITLITLCLAMLTKFY